VNNGAFGMGNGPLYLASTWVKGVVFMVIILMFTVRVHR